MSNVQDTFVKRLKHTIRKHPNLLRLSRKVRSLMDSHFRNDPKSVSKLTRQLKYQIDEPRSPAYAFLAFQEIQRQLELNKVNVQSVLELGTGATLGILFCFIAHGAKRAVGVDIAPIQQDIPYFERLKDYLSVVAGFGWYRPFLEPSSRDPQVEYSEVWGDVSVMEVSKKIEYHAPVRADQLPFSDNEFDLVYSCSAMEHFDQPRKSIEEMYRVLEPGGFAVHGIDMQSHNDKGKLSLLKLSEAEHDQISQKYDPEHGLTNILKQQWSGQVYCNRVLANEWRQYFVDAGFEIIEFKILATLRLDSVVPSEFAAPFNAKSREELAPLVIRVVARKPK